MTNVSIVSLFNLTYLKSPLSQSSQSSLLKGLRKGLRVIERFEPLLFSEVLTVDRSGLCVLGQTDMLIIYG